MKNKLLMLVSSGVLGMSLIAGVGTYAFFSASTTNSGNTFTAGTVNISSQRDEADSVEVPGPMFYGSADDLGGRHPYDASTAYAPNDELPGDWAPGDSISRMLNVQNTGILDFKITKIEANLQSIVKNGLPVDSGTQAYTDFMNDMTIKVYAPGIVAPVYTGTLTNLLSGYQPLTTNLVLAEGTTAYDMTFTASMDSSARNDIEGVKGVFGFTLYAEQVRNNP